MWTVITALTIVACLQFVDLAVAEWARSHAFDPYRDTFETISLFGQAKWYLYAFSSLALLAWALGWRRCAAACATLFFAVLASGLLVQLIKLLVGRHRPKAFVEDGMYGFAWLTSGYETASFPSGHTATVAAIAASMWMLLPHWRDLWLIPIGLVGFSRILNGAHYPSDIIAGAYVGALTAFLVFRTVRYTPLSKP